MATDRTRRGTTFRSIVVGVGITAAIGVVAPSHRSDAAAGTEYNRPLLDVDPSILRRAAETQRASPGDATFSEIVIPVIGRAKGLLGTGRISPDGRYLSYADQLRRDLGGTGNLAVLDLRSGETVIVNKSSNVTAYADGVAEASIWSPRGDELAYTWQPRATRTSELRVVGFQSGLHRTIFRSSEGAWLNPLAWATDGRHIVAALGQPAGSGTVGSSELTLISVADGSARTIRRFEADLPGGGAFAPDGKWIAYDIQTGPGRAARDVVLLELETRREVRLAADPSTDERVLGWFPDGRVLGTRDRAGTFDVWAARVVGGAIEREPVVVKPDVGSVQPQGVTRDGTVAVQRVVAVQEIYVAELDPVTGKATAPPAPLANLTPNAKRRKPAWSPDGARIAYFQHGGATPDSIVVRSTTSPDVREYPVPVRNVDWPVWRPDGRELFIDGTGSDNIQRTFALDLDTGQVRPASEPRRLVFGFSPDGQFIYEAGAGRGLARRSVAGGTTEALGPGAPGMTLSPNGEWIAYFVANRQRGESILAIRPASGGVERTLVERFSAGYVRPAWTPDSRHVIFDMQPGGLHRVPIEGGPPQSLGIDGLSMRDKSMNRDGRRLAIAVERADLTLLLWNNIVTKEKQARGGAILRRRR